MAVELAVPTTTGRSVELQRLCHHGEISVSHSEPVNNLQRTFNAGDTLSLGSVGEMTPAPCGLHARGTTSVVYANHLAFAYIPSTPFCNSRWSRALLGWQHSSCRCYYTYVSIGSPPRKFAVTADTGSAVAGCDG